jgi:hypothetical protein
MKDLKMLLAILLLDIGFFGEEISSAVKVPRHMKVLPHRYYPANTLSAISLDGNDHYSDKL